MTATYDETLPTDKDRARAMLGDTNLIKALHSDEHITAVIAAEGSLMAGVAFLANELYVRFAREPVKWEADGTKMDYSGRLEAWRSLAASAQAGVAGAGMSFVPAKYGAADPPVDEYGIDTRYPWNS